MATKKTLDSASVPVTAELIPRKDLIAAQTRERIEFHHFDETARKVVKIASDADLTIASEIKAKLMTLRESWRARFTPAKKALKIATDTIKDIESEIDDLYKTRLNALDTLISAYTTERRQKALAAELERQRLAQRLKDEKDELLRKAEAAKTTQMRNRLIEKAVDVEIEADTIQQTAAPTRFQNDLFRDRVYLKCEVIDMEALIMYVASTLKPGSKRVNLAVLLKVDQTELNALLDLEKVTMATGDDWIPGVRVFENVTQVRKSNR